MLCMDNSEYMRNSDYAPSRLQAQKDAVNLLCSRHIGADGAGGTNAESTIGLLTMAGKCVDVRAAPSRNRNLLYQAADGIPLKGSAQIVKAVKIAQLALKHGIETKGIKRVVVFVGSPVQDTAKALKKVGKHLRRNNVSVDAVMMGDFPDNEVKLKALVDTARTEDGPPCELVTIPPGVRPVDVLRRTHLCGGSSTGAAAAAAATGGSSGPAGTTGGGNFDQYGGFDPSVDPEMAQAMQMSMMEERARMEKAIEESKKDAHVVDDEDETEEEMLAKALELSRMAVEAPVMDSAAAIGSTSADSTDADSTPPAKKSRKEPVTSDVSATQTASDDSAVTADAGDLDLNDPAALAMLLNDVGVGADDPLIQAALEQINEDPDNAADGDNADEGGDQKTE